MADYPGFCGPSAIAQSPTVDNERTVNWYLEKWDVPGGSSQLAMYPTPGYEVFATTSGSQGRAHFTFRGRDFAVIGTGVYEVLSSGSATLLGSVAVDQYPATLSTNGDGGNQIFVTSGNNGYIYNLDTAAFTQVRTGATRMGAHLDGYFLALDADTSTLYISDLLDGTVWDGTQFAQRSARPDPWISMAVLDRYIWLLGEETSEIWYNAGTFPFPFALHPSGLVPFGCGAPFSPAVVNGDTLIWFMASADGNGQIVGGSGFRPSVLSSLSLSVAFGSYTQTSDAIGDTYQDLGHTFYLLTFPAAQKTVAYDATTTMQLPQAMRWAERGTWIAESMMYDAARPLFHSFAFGQHLMLDRASGTIYRQSASLGLDVGGRPIRRLRRPPALWMDNQYVSVPEFEVYLEPGLGATTGQGSDPSVALRVSPDGGKTFGAERLRSAGARGKYGARVRWLRNGRGRKWQPEIVVTDPIPYRVLGAGGRFLPEAGTGRAA
jgi:hypothetical protein